MKKVLLLIVAFACVVANLDAKDKTIKLTKRIVYRGAVEKKVPSGEGVIQVENKANPSPTISIKGTFADDLVSNAEISFSNGASYKGDIKYGISKDPEALAIALFPGGEFLDKDGNLIGVVSKDCYSIAVVLKKYTYIRADGVLIERPPVRNLEDYIRYANDESYQVEYGVNHKLHFVIEEDEWRYSPAEFARACTVRFSNGTVIKVETNGQERWEKPSGEWMLVQEDSTEGIVVKGYRVDLSDGNYMEKERVRYTFENGNVYEGASCSDFFPNDYMNLIGLKTIDWKWEDFFSGVSTDGGTLCYSDGSKYEGSFILPSKKAPLTESVLPESCYYTGQLLAADGNVLHTYEKGKDEAERERIRLAYEKAKETDFVTFYSEYSVSAFKKTFPDLTVIEAKKGDSWDYFEEFKITYPDGIIYTDTGYSRDTKDVKSVLSWDFAPSFGDLFFIGYQYKNVVSTWKWVFPDGLVLSCGPKSQYSRYFNDRLVLRYVNISIQLPQSDNGDYAVFQCYDVRGQDKENVVTYLKKTFPDCKVEGKGSEWYSWLEGSISYKNGSCFKGSFHISHLPSITPAIASDPRIKALGDFKIVTSLDNVVLDSLWSGKEYDANGKLVAIYKEGKKLDDFDFAQALQLEKEQQKAAEKRAEEEKKKEKESQAQYEKDCKKYGKKYVDSWENNDVILVGTPEEYFLNSVGNVEKYYESQTTRSYRVYTVFGKLGLSVDVDKKTKRVTNVYDHR